jgi:hypothetical protein
VEWFNQVDATYRADLRELNELNFARFDAKLEQRIAEVKAEVRQVEASLQEEVGERFRSLETRMEVGFASLRADMVKWLFGMWVTLLGAMVALTKLG